MIRDKICWWPRQSALPVAFLGFSFERKAFILVFPQLDTGYKRLVA